MKTIVIWMLALSWMVAGDAWYKAFLTSHEFTVEGLLYSYDFNEDGKIDHNEYLFLTAQRLYHTDLARGYPLVLVPIEFDLQKAKFLGYVATLEDERLFLSKDGEVYKFLNGASFFDLVDTDLTYEIENHSAAIVYRELKDFKNIIAHYDTPGFAWSMILDGERIIVADGKEGLLALDYINEAFEPAWSYKSGGEVIAVEKVGEGLYALGTDDGLEIYDAKNEKLLKKAFDGSVVSKIHLQNGKLYFLVENRGVFVMDEAYRITPIDTTLRHPQDFTLTPHAIYIADGFEGVVEVGKRSRVITERDDIKALTLYKKRYLLMLPWQSKKVLIYDLHSQKLGELLAHDQIERMKIVGDAIYFLHKSAMVSKWKMNDAKGATIVQTAYLPYPSFDIVFKDKKFAYVADGGFGVLCLTCQ